MFKIISKNNQGFTLIEIVFVLTIAVMIVYVTSTFIISGFRSTIFTNEQNIAVKNARKINENMVNEIREAIQSEVGDYVLNTVEAQTLIFYSDIDKDSNIEKVRYFLDSSVLKRGLIKPSGTPPIYNSNDEIVTDVADYINNQSEQIFTYYDKNNNLIANPSLNKTQIRLIHISLKVNVTPTVAPNDYYVEMDAQLRNLKDNL